MIHTRGEDVFKMICEIVTNHLKSTPAVFNSISVKNK